MLQLMRNSLRVTEVHLFRCETAFTSDEKKRDRLFCRSLHPIPFNCSGRLPRDYNCKDTLLQELIMRACLLLVLLISCAITFASILLCLRVFQSSFSSDNSFWVSRLLFHDPAGIVSLTIPEGFFYFRGINSTFSLLRYIHFSLFPFRERFLPCTSHKHGRPSREAMIRRPARVFAFLDGTVSARRCTVTLTDACDMETFDRKTPSRDPRSLRHYGNENDHSQTIVRRSNFDFQNVNTLYASSGKHIAADWYINCVRIKPRIFAVFRQHSIQFALQIVRNQIESVTF